MCGLPDDAAAEELRAAGVDAVTLTRLLARREKTGWAARSDTVELCDERGRRTDLAVHVPPAVDGRQLGAMIVLHGAGGTGSGVLPFFSGLGDRLGMAVVCPTAQLPPQARNNLDLAGLFGKRFDRPGWDLRGDGLVLAALRWVRTELDVDPDRCVIAGVSMGGLATWNTGMRFWHSFCAAVPINGALSIWESFGPDRRTRALLPNTLPLSLFVVHGARDEQIPAEFDRTSVADLRALGHPDLQYAEVPDGEHGVHTLGLTAGAPLFHRLERWLEGRRRVGPPVEIRHRAHDDRHGRAHWVAVNGIKQHGMADLWACRTGEDRVDVSVTGADRITLHLRSDMFTPANPVRVSINGIVSTVPFEPDIATVVRSYRDTADPGLTAERIVSLPVP